MTPPCDLEQLKRRREIEAEVERWEPEFLEEARNELRESLPVQAGVEYQFGDEDGNDTGVKAFRLTIFGEETEYLEEIAVDAKRRGEAFLAAPGHADEVTVDKIRKLLR